MLALIRLCQTLKNGNWLDLGGLIERGNGGGRKEEMKHRNLNHELWTPAAIDSCITRGRQQDWDEMRQAALDDQEIMVRLNKIAGCEKNLKSPFDDLVYQEWWRWVQDPERESWGPNFKDCGGI